jgi:competence protein ComEC
VLPLTRGHHLVLDALVRIADQAEQERCVLVVEIRARPAAEPRRIAVETEAAARERGVPVRIIRAGSEFKAGGLALRALWPPDPGFRTEDPNLNALVLVATYGEMDVFLPADAESDVTARLPLDDVELMKVAHHGSADPGLGEELRVLRPRIAVISCGRNNDYGHPRAETLAALAGSPGLAVYRTDTDGRVVVESDGRRIQVRTQS